MIAYHGIVIARMTITARGLDQMLIFNRKFVDITLLGHIIE